MYSNFLSEVPFFSEVSPVSLKHFSKGLTEAVFRKGEIVFVKESPGTSMYVIVEGSVSVHENDHVYGKLIQGDCFGEYALIDGRPRSASVTCLEETRVLQIARSHFMELIKNDSGFAQGILHVMIKRHRELDAIQEQLASSKKELEHTNNTMNGLINGAMDAIVMFNKDFRILLTNTAACKQLENSDVIQRNLLFFLEDKSAALISELVGEGMEKEKTPFNIFLPEPIKVIGSDGLETLNEGTLSMFGKADESNFLLILRNMEERIRANNKIHQLTTQTQYLEEEITELTSTYGMVAEDARMKEVISLVNQVAVTDATVLITGETGTGKELVARAIHKASKRNHQPLIRINCGAIPANLIESELFGHEKGAFTGATASRKGRFLLADKGTIFLDEIGELPLELQPKLLRVLQEGEFDPVGSSETVSVDVRIIAATHRDLLKRAGAGNFREDLFYRLNVFPIQVPPLRERGGDIHLIAQEMISHFCKKLGKPAYVLTGANKAVLTSYSWPGNVRELQNLMERLVILSNPAKTNWSAFIPGNNGAPHEKNSAVPARVLTAKEMTALERANILKALKQTGWKISGKNGAAALLQIPPTTLASKVKALGISRPV